MRKVEADEYKKIVLNILIKIDQLCKDNDIEYCIFYGALIGAVRHGGYIPWDDDIDLVMRREEYDKLRNVIMNAPNCGLNFIDISTNKETIYTFAKVCDTSTKVVDRHFLDVDGYGAFIDIFPFDYLPGNVLSRKLVMKYCQLLNRLRAVGSRKKPDNGLHGMKRFKALIAYVFTKLIHSSSIVKMIDGIGRKSNEKPSQYIGIIRNPREVYPLSWLFPTKAISFEGHVFSGPAFVHECLSHEYGNYMELPPESQRIPHHIDCWYCEDNR